MKPEVKATISLPFAILVIGGILYLFAAYATIISTIILDISALAILGAIWYGLYRFFGGED